MRYENPYDLDKLWASVSYDRLEADQVLQARGYKLRAMIRHLDDDGTDAIFLTYAPDIDTRSLTPIARDLLIVGKGRGSRCGVSAATSPSGRSGSKLLDDGRSMTWAAGIPPWKEIRPAWISWESRDGQTCRVEGVDVTLQTLVDIGRQLAAQPGG